MLENVLRQFRISHLTRQINLQEKDIKMSPFQRIFKKHFASSLSPET